MTSGRRPAAASSATPRANPSAPVGVDAPSGTTNGWRPAAREVVGDLCHLRRARVAARRRSARIGAEQPIEPRVAGRRRRRRAVEDEHDRKPERGAGGGGDARVIGLQPAARDERVGAGGARFGRHRLHLPHFVAAQAERQQVVALHEESRARRRPTPLRRRVSSIDRRRMRRERDGRERHQGGERGGHRHPPYLYSLSILPMPSRARKRRWWSALARLVRRVGRAAPASRGARCRRRHGRVDRHVSRGARPRARRDVRVPDRQRRRRARRAQSAAPRHQSRAPTCRAIAWCRSSRRSIRSSSVSSYAERAWHEGLPLARRPRRRSRGRPAAVRGARLAAARGDSRARARAHARRLGESARGRGRRRCGFSATVTSTASSS